MLHIRKKIRASILSLTACTSTIVASNAELQCTTDVIESDVILEKIVLKDINSPIRIETDPSATPMQVISDIESQLSTFPGDGSAILHIETRSMPLLKVQNPEYFDNINKRFKTLQDVIDFNGKIPPKIEYLFSPIIVYGYVSYYVKTMSIAVDYIESDSNKISNTIEIDADFGSAMILLLLKGQFQIPTEKNIRAALWIKVSNGFKVISIAEGNHSVHNTRPFVNLAIVLDSLQGELKNVLVENDIPQKG